MESIRLMRFLRQHILRAEEDDRLAYGEVRLRSLGLFYGIVVHVVWVERDETAHLISVRKATRYEERQYWQAFGR